MWKKTRNGRRFNKELGLYECTRCKKILDKKNFSSTEKGKVNVVTRCHSCNRDLYVYKNPEKKLFKGVTYFKYPGQTVWRTADRTKLICTLCGEPSTPHQGGKCKECYKYTHNTQSLKYTKDLSLGYMLTRVIRAAPKLMGKVVSKKNIDIDPDTLELLRVLHDCHRESTMILKTYPLHKRRNLSLDKLLTIKNQNKYVWTKEK